MEKEISEKDERVKELEAQVKVLEGQVKVLEGQVKKFKREQEPIPGQEDGYAVFSHIEKIANSLISSHLIS